MQKYTLYIGRYDKDTKAVELTYDIFTTIIDDTLRKYNIECFTIIDGQGCYKHEDGTRVHEPTIIVEVVTTLIMYQTLISIKKELCKALNQEDILITCQELRVLDIPIM